MSLQYLPKFSLGCQHTDAITSVAFSPDGRFLASASDDRKIVIWSLLSAESLHVVVAKAEVLCLVWLSCSDLILAGTGDGTLLDLQIDETTVLASGFFAHAEGIQSLSVNCDGVLPQNGLPSCREHWLATAAFAEVKIWQLDCECRSNACWIFIGIERTHVSLVIPAAAWSHTHTLSKPPSTQFSGVHTAEATSVQWLAKPENDCLVVSYLYHGIICWRLDGENTMMVWSIVMPLCGMCKVAADNKLLVANNITAGFSIYEIPSGVQRLGLCVPNEQPHMILPMLFHDERLLLGASNIGKLRLRSVEDGEHFQTLRLRDKLPIQALDVFRAPGGDKFMVAAGTGKVGSANYIQIWETIIVEP